MKRFVEIIKNPIKYIKSINSISYDFNLFNTFYLTSSILGSVILFFRFPLNGIMRQPRILCKVFTKPPR